MKNEDKENVMTKKNVNVIYKQMDKQRRCTKFKTLPFLRLNTRKKTERKKEKKREKQEKRARKEKREKKKKGKLRMLFFSL